MSTETQNKANDLFDALDGIREDMIKFAGELEGEGCYGAGTGMREMAQSLDTILDDYDRWLAMDMRPLG